MMKATLSGSYQGRSLAVEVPADLEAWFNEVRRRLGITNAKMMSYIMAGQPADAKLTPELVESFLSRMERGRVRREVDMPQPAAS